MIWHDNSFETLQMEDIETLAEQEGIAEYNITTANIVVNPVNFKRIEDPDVDQHSDLLGVCLCVGIWKCGWTLMCRMGT